MLGSSNTVFQKSKYSRLVFQNFSCNFLIIFIEPSLLSIRVASNMYNLSGHEELYMQHMSAYVSIIQHSSLIYKLKSKRLNKLTVHRTGTEFVAGIFHWMWATFSFGLKTENVYKSLTKKKKKTEISLRAYIFQYFSK